MAITAKPGETAQAISGRKRREATRALVLAATRRLVESGTPVADLSVGRIAEEAGVARPTFYLHFKDKYGPVEALTEEHFSWREEIGVEDLGAPDLSRETVQRMLDDIVARWSANHAVLAAIIEVAEYDPRVRDAWRRAMREVADTAAAQFEAHWRGSGSRPRDPALIAEVFTWMFERTCHQLLEDGDAAPGLADAMTEVIWRTLAFEPRHAAR